MKTRKIERVRRVPAQPTKRWRWPNMMSFPQSGKLTGKFDVWMDLDPVAARAFAQTLVRLADEADKAPLGDF